MRKIKKFIVLVVVILIGLGGYLLGKEYRAEPPEPVVVIGEKKVPVIRGTYCWSSFMRNICVDTVSPPGMISFKNHAPITAAPGTEVNVDFKKKPLTDSVHLSRWLNEEESIQVPLTGNKFVLPEEEGTYVYDVSANWNQGDAVYAFVIEVK